MKIAKREAVRFDRASILARYVKIMSWYLGIIVEPANILCFRAAVIAA